MIIDILLVAVLVLCIYMGHRRGLVRTLSKLCSFVLSIIVALLSYKKIAGLITDSVVGEFIKGKISESISVSGTDFSKLPEFLKTPLESGVIEITETVAVNMTDAVVSIIAVVITILVAKLLISIVFKALNVFAKLPVLKQFNKLFGILLGVVNGYFWMCIVLYVISHLVNIASLGFLNEQLNTSVLALFLEDNNLLTMLFPIMRR